MGPVRRLGFAQLRGQVDAERDRERASCSLSSLGHSSAVAVAHLDESSGYQVGSQAEIETTVADAVMNYLRSQKEVVKVVPDGVSLEVFERLPPKALITVHDARGWGCGSHVFCPHDKVVKPDDTVDNVARVVTFLPGGESKQALPRSSSWAVGLLTTGPALARATPARSAWPALPACAVAAACRTPGRH